MVGSNSLSGLGRVALCESLESRSMFNQDGGLDANFGGDGVVVTRFGGGSERAISAAPLKDGRVLVSGVSDGVNGEHTVFALYKTDGSLDASFSGDGKLVLTDTQQAAIGIVSRMYVLPGGSYLLSSGQGVFRMKANGTLDSGFGTNGRVDVRNAQLRINADGSFRTYSYDGQYSSGAQWTPQGKLIGSATPAVYGRPILLDDGRVLMAGYKAQLTLYTYDLKKIKTFGTSGDAYLQGNFDKYLRDGRPWTDPQGNKLTGVPSYNIDAFSPTRDGGYLISATIFGKSTKYNNWTSTGNGDLTYVTARLDSAGRFVGFINATDQYGYSKDNRTAVDYRGNPGQFDGNLYFGVGDGINIGTYSFDGEYSNSSNAYAVPAAGGKYAMIGYSATKSSNYNLQFTVALTKKITQSITGTLFSDNNVNGVQDKGDNIVPGRVVYLDENYNDKLDAGEPTVKTDANGKYVFSNLGVGDFYVRRVLPDKSYYVTTNTYKTTLAVGQDATVDIGSTNKKMKDQTLA